MMGTNVRYTICFILSFIRSVVRNEWPKEVVTNKCNNMIVGSRQRHHLCRDLMAVPASSMHILESGQQPTQVCNAIKDGTNFLVHII